MQQSDTSFEILTSYGAGYLAHLGLFALASFLLIAVLRMCRLEHSRLPVALVMLVGGTLILLTALTPLLPNARLPRIAIKAALLVTSATLALRFSRSALVAQVLQFAWIPTAVGAFAALAAIVVVTKVYIGETSTGKDQPLRLGPGAPIVIWISFDTFSALHSSTYGYVRDTTTSLSTIAKSAYLFERNYSNSNFTTPSIASLLTGQLPWTHRQVQLISRPARPTRNLMDELAHHGFYTACSSSNPFASPLHHRIQACSKDTLEVPGASFQLKVTYWLESLGLSPGINWIGLFRFSSSILPFAGPIPPGTQNNPRAQFDYARKVLASHRDTATAIWLHVMPPHDPYVAPPPFLGTFDPGPEARSVFDSSPEFAWRQTDAHRVALLESRYDENLRFADHELGLFLDWLKEQGLYDRALIAINADHGESFHQGFSGHGGPLLSEELIRVPLVLKLPFQTTPVRVRSPSGNSDFAPTVLSVLGFPAPSAMEGQSLIERDSAGKFIPATSSHAILSMNFERTRSRGNLDVGSVALVEQDTKYVLYLRPESYPGSPALVGGSISLTGAPFDAEERSAASIPDATRRKVEDLLRVFSRPRTDL